MDQKQFEEFTEKVCVAFLKNAAHSFGLPVYEINQLLIEIDKRKLKRKVSKK